jgi:hypothetical protein
MLGCGYERGTGVDYPPGIPATVAVSATTTDPLVAAGETRVLDAIVRDRNGTLMAAPGLIWRTSAPGVATVSGTGETATVTAVDDGTAIITASVGSVEGTLTIIVRRRVASIELSAPDSVVAAGATMPLTVIVRDARQQPVTGLSGVTFTSNNPFGVLVSPDGVVSALFNPFHPPTAIVTASVVRDGVTLTTTKRIDVGSGALPVLDFAAFLLTESVRPDPAPGLGIGISFFTRDGDRVQYKLLWSLLSGPPVIAHVHGPDAQDGVAPVLVELSLGSQTGTHGAATGSFSGTDIRGVGGNPAITLDSLLALLKTPASAYVDVHTERFGDGEMRGPIVSVP